MLNFHSVGQENDGGAGSVGLADAALHQDPPEEEEHGESEKLQSLNPTLTRIDSLQFRLNESLFATTLEATPVCVTVIWFPSPFA